MEHEKWNQRYRNRGEPAVDSPSPVLLRTISQLKPGRALVLAAGTGRNAFALARQGWDTVAVDFSEEAICRGKAKAEEMNLPVNWELADLTTYIPAKKYYDFVSLFYLHIPWNEFQQVLLQAAEALASGGTLLIVGHDRTNISQGTGGPQNPRLLYSPEDISALLPSLTIKTAQTERHPVDHGNSSGGEIQIDCVVRAEKPTQS